MRRGRPRPCSAALAARGGLVVEAAIPAVGAAGPRPVAPAPRPTGRREFTGTWTPVAPDVLQLFGGGRGRPGARRASGRCRGRPANRSDGERDDEDAGIADVTAAGGDPDLLRDPVTDGRPAGRRHVRHAGARHAGDDRPAGTGPARRGARAQHRATGPTGPVGISADQLAGALLPALQHAAGPDRLDGLPCGIAGARPVGRAGVRIPLAGGDLPDPAGGDPFRGELSRRRGTSRWARSATCCARPAAGRPVRRLRRAAGVAGDVPAVAARLSDREPGRRVPAARPPLRGGGLQDELARRFGAGGPGSAAHASAGTTGRRRSTRRWPVGLSVAGAAVLRCAAPVPAVAAARLRPGAAIGGVLYLFVRGHVRAADIPRWTAGRAAFSAGVPPADLVIELSALLDGRRRCAMTARRDAPRPSRRAERRSVGRPVGAGRHGLLRESNQAGVLTRPTCTLPAGWRSWPGRPTRRFCWHWRWRSAASAAVRCASTWRQARQCCGRPDGPGRRCRVG